MAKSNWKTLVRAIHTADKTLKSSAIRDMLSQINIDVTAAQVAGIKAWNF